VTARTAATVYELGRDTFLAAVLGHAPTHRQAARLAQDLLTGDATGIPPAGREPMLGP